MARFVLFLVMVLLAACTEQRSAACNDVCTREATCADQLEAETFRFDKNECIASCTRLERDPLGNQLVVRHVECVVAAGDQCESILACNSR